MSYQVWSQGYGYPYPTFPHTRNWNYTTTNPYYPSRYPMVPGYSLGYPYYQPSRAPVISSLWSPAPWPTRQPHRLWPEWHQNPARPSSSTTTSASTTATSGSSTASASTTTATSNSSSPTTTTTTCPICSPSTYTCTCTCPTSCTCDTLSTVTVCSCSSLSSTTDSSTSESTAPYAPRRRQRLPPLPGILNYNPHLVTIRIRHVDYLVLRPLLLRHMPRIEQRQGRHVQLLDARQVIPADVIQWFPAHLRRPGPGLGAELLDTALGVLVRHLEAISRTNRDQRLMETLGWRISESPRVARMANSMLEVVVAMALIMDGERGVGCSEELAEDMGDVMVWLGRVVRRVSGPKNGLMVELMVSLARVFRGTKKAKWQLRGLWQLLESDEIDEIREVVGRLTTRRRNPEDPMILFREALAGLP